MSKLLDRNRVRAGILFCALVVAPVWAADEGGEPVIPPGQEALLAAMLGRGGVLAEGCQLTGAGVEYSVVKATYACPWGEVTLHLAHASRATTGTPIQTAQFAIGVERGWASDALAQSVVSLVRSRENAFVWNLAATEAGADGDDDEPAGD